MRLEEFSVFAGGYSEEDFDLKQLVDEMFGALEQVYLLRLTRFLLKS